MIGVLPTSLDISGISYPIETDYRNILVFLAACNDPDFTAAEKLEILMKRLYRDGFYEIPQEHMEEAILRAKWFVDCGQEDDDKKPARKVMDWEQDEPILFPAINKVAGMETRAVPYIHWWTFFRVFYGDRGRNLFHSPGHPTKEGQRQETGKVGAGILSEQQKAL